jgi:Fe-S oxidoreductase
MRLESYKSELIIPIVEQKDGIGYHLSCHFKVLKIGKSFVDLLKLIPGLEANTMLNYCCSKIETMGFRKKKFDQSQKSASPLIQEIKKSSLSWFWADEFLVKGK